ncbi:MAG TPA: NAD-dependent epimerase/dehydratase family protein [Myxococcaceae bacterium]|jgi:CDP-paratose 2-epimerase
MKYLITGGAGFLGSNLAAEVLRRGEALSVLDNLSRTGSDANLRWLQEQGRFGFFQAGSSSYDAVEQVVREVRPDVVFHLAGQVAMTTSLENPRLDFETNVMGGHNVLEAIRRCAPEAIVLFSSTNKVYGDLDQIRFRETETRYVAEGHEQGFTEELPLDFRSPYGCSKGAVDQYMLDYARSFGLRTVVFRHSSIFGGRQFSTFDQGWVGWFVQQALETRRAPDREPFTISGDGKQVRDVLFASDLVRCYFSAVAQVDRARGQAFNIGGGPENSLSLLELFRFLEAELDVKLQYRSLPWRKSDQKVFIACNAKATKAFGWAPELRKKDGIRRMIDWVRSHG